MKVINTKETVLGLKGKTIKFLGYEVWSSHFSRNWPGELKKGTILYIDDVYADKDDNKYVSGLGIDTTGKGWGLSLCYTRFEIIGSISNSLYETY